MNSDNEYETQYQVTVLLADVTVLFLMLLTGSGGECASNLLAPSLNQLVYYITHSKAPLLTLIPCQTFF